MRRRDVGSLPDWSHTNASQLVVPLQNRCRSCCLQLTQDLFGDWIIIRSWGRIGKSQRVQLQTFSLQLDTEILAQQLIRRRLLYGYGVTAVTSS